jgi:hypothetical protein
MDLLPKVFFTIGEAAARWGYAPADIAGWAHQGLLEIVTGIGPVECEGEHAAGLLAISVADILPMFRRSGTGPRELPLRRIRLQGNEAWLLITSPAEGVVVSMDDLLILAEEVHRFEVEREIFGKPHRGKGPDPKFEWEDFWRAVAVLIHEKGVPAKLTDFINEMADWFMDQSGGKKCPSNSVIRKKLSPLWNRLREED